MSSSEANEKKRWRPRQIALGLAAVFLLYVFSASPVHWLVLKHYSAYRAVAVTLTYFGFVRVLREETPCGYVLEPWDRFCAWLILGDDED